VRLPRLYAIVDRGVLEARGVEVRAFARELREAGVRLVQYRDKEGSPERILRAAEEIAEAFAGVGATLILNDRADLAVLAGWDGVHVGQGDLAVEDARRVMEGMGPHPSRQERREEWGTRRVGVVGVSTHTEEQVRAAEAGGPGYRGADYVAIGPVFGTRTKPDAEAVVGLAGVRRARELTAKPLVAIGGITRENARSVIEAGADSVAVISGLMEGVVALSDWE
jgi:thiamine-phosphate pyrophosphorylase